MSKGTGTSSSGGTGKTLSLRSIVNRSGGVVSSVYARDGMRSLASARADYAGKSPAQATRIANTLKHPIRIHIEPAGKHGSRVILNDGRHRMTAAKEAGAKSIRAHVVEYGARGGKRREWIGSVKL